MVFSLTPSVSLRSTAPSQRERKGRRGRRPLRSNIPINYNLYDKPTKKSHRRAFSSVGKFLLFFDDMLSKLNTIFLLRKSDIYSFYSYAI